MAEKKTTKALKEEAKTAAAAATAAAPAEKKTAEKKTTVRKTAERKTADKSKAVKTTGTARARKPAKAVVTLDDLTTAIWKKIENKDVKTIPFAIAIQVNVFETGTFYVAVNADPEYDKQVIQSDYYLADGIVDTSADEIKKIAAGEYNFIEAVKAGKFNYRGDLNKGICIAELIK